MRLPLLLSVALAATVLTPDLARLSLSPRPAEASVSLELSLTDLVSASALVVVATPLEARAVWEDGDGARGRRIVTYHRVRLDRVLDGAAKPGDEAWVRTLGGQVGKIGQHVDGDAILVREQPTLLFLHARGDGTHMVTGLGQGQFPLATAADGKARLAQNPQMGEVLPKPSATTAPARARLVGKTIDEAAAIVATERQAHAR